MSQILNLWKGYMKIKHSLLKVILLLSLKVDLVHARDQIYIH